MDGWIWTKSDKIELALFAEIMSVNVQLYFAENMLVFFTEAVNPRDFRNTQSSSSLWIPISQNESNLNTAQSDMAEQITVSYEYTIKPIVTDRYLYSAVGLF